MIILQFIWRKLVWGRGPIPKHRMFLWLTILDKMKTRDRLSKWMPDIDTVCYVEMMRRLETTCLLSVPMLQR